MQTVNLPWGLRRLQEVDFPRKLGVCERLFGRALERHGSCWVRTGAGLDWKLDLRNVTHRWIVYGKYEGAPFLDWARRHLPPDGVVVDSGANIGQMLLYLAQWIPRGKVLAFEPGPAAGDWLQECLQAHPGLPVELLRMGLGASADPKRLAQLGPDHIHGAWNQISETEGIAIPMVRLADVLRERSLSNVDLWKLDVEGSEVQAMQGAEPLLKEHRIRALYVELIGDNARRVRDYLDSFGYRGYLVKSGGRLAPLSGPHREENGLFLPDDR